MRDDHRFGWTIAKSTRLGSPPSASCADKNELEVTVSTTYVVDVVDDITLSTKAGAAANYYYCRDAAKIDKTRLATLTKLRRVGSAC